jgi:hypothetical protein
MSNSMNIVIGCKLPSIYLIQPSSQVTVFVEQYHCAVAAVFIVQEYRFLNQVDSRSDDSSQEIFWSMWRYEILFSSTAYLAW